MMLCRCPSSTRVRSAVGRSRSASPGSGPPSPPRRRGSRDLVSTRWTPSSSEERRRGPSQGGVEGVEPGLPVGGRVQDLASTSTLTVASARSSPPLRRGRCSRRSERSDIAAAMASDEELEARLRASHAGPSEFELLMTFDSSRGRPIELMAELLGADFMFAGRRAGTPPADPLRRSPGPRADGSRSTLATAPVEPPLSRTPISEGMAGGPPGERWRSRATLRAEPSGRSRSCRRRTAPATVEVFQRQVGQDVSGPCSRCRRRSPSR